MLSPVKREESFYRDPGRRSDDDQPLGATAGAAAKPSQTGVLHGLASAQTKTHLAVSVSSAAVADKVSGGTAPAAAAVAGMSSSSSAGEKHVQQCVFCAQSFKSKGELERHVKSTHVLSTTSQKCNICDEVFASAAVLAEHKLTHCKVNTPTGSCFRSIMEIVNNPNCLQYTSNLIKDTSSLVYCLMCVTCLFYNIILGLF